jgi:hypothetical protein
LRSSFFEVKGSEVEEEEIKPVLIQVGENIWTIVSESKQKEEHARGEQISSVRSENELQPPLDLGE